MKFYTDVVRDGKYLLVRSIDNGRNKLEKIKYEPYIFVTSEKEQEYTDYYKKNHVSKVCFDDMYELSKFIKNYKDLDNHLWGTSDPIIQYIEENYKNEYEPSLIRGAFIDIEVMTRQKADDGSWIDGGFPNASDASFPINAICHYDNLDDTYHLFGLGTWNKEKSCYPELADKTIFYSFSQEETLLKEYLKFFKAKDPHYITGWNVETFDIPYIINRYTKILGENSVKQFSPWNHIDERIVNTKWGDEHIFTIWGIPILDYLALYKKYTFKNRESYTLDYIAYVELKEHKKAFEGTHGSFYWEDPQGFFDYNINDVYLVKGLDDKLKLLNLVFSIAYFSGINWVSTFSPIKTWSSLIYHRCLQVKALPPIKNKHVSREAYEGAYVHEPVKGMYTDIVSMDFTSLYPSIMREWNIGPDTFISDIDILKELDNVSKCDTSFYEAYLNKNIVAYTLKKREVPDKVKEFLKKYDCSMAMNCSLYTKQYESIVYAMLTELFLGRKADKKKAQAAKKRIKEEENTLTKEELDSLKSEFSIFDTSQLVKKILLNSLYGALGSNFFDYYNPKVAEAITYNGQFLVQDSAVYTIDYLNKIKKSEDYLTYGDTDSVYFNVSELVKNIDNKQEKIEFLDKLFIHIEKKVLPVRFKELSDFLNTYCSGDILHMDREVIAVSDKENGQEYAAFWAAKKKYGILVNNLEGVPYETPYLKVMGLSLVQASTPAFFRDKLSEYMRIFISEGKNSKEYVKKVHEEYQKLDIEELAFPRSVSNVLKYVVNGEIVKGTPIQAKAAIHYNMLLNKFGLHKKYQIIRDGDKIKFLFLKENPYGFDTIAMKDKFPPEFKLDEYIDKEKHYYKAFQKPIEDMFSVCGWELEGTMETDDLFG